MPPRPCPWTIFQAAHEQAVAAANEAKKEFDELARLAAVKNESRVAEILTGGPLENVLVHCRPTDLVVIGQANPDQPEPMRELLIETILFESGVPVLLIPYIGSKSFQPQNVLVGWDGSSTATRAIHAALPVLEKAEKITLLVIEKKATTANGQPGADVANYLARHNMNVTVEVVTNPAGRHCRHRAQLCQRQQQRPCGHGRLRPQPHARIPVRRRHQRNPGSHDRTGSDGALTENFAVQKTRRPDTIGSAGFLFSSFDAGHPSGAR